MIDFISLAILSFATWRLSSLLVQEDGPYQILLTIRNATNLFNCIWCISVWAGIAIVIAWLLFPAWTVFICLPFALSAIAIMFDRWSQ